MRPTAKRIRQLLDYDPATGIFRWRNKMIGKAHGGGPILAGSVAGAPSSDGGWRIKIDKRECPAAVVAFVYMKGRWPRGDVDHEDRHRRNNRWGNLREATRSQNIANMGTFEHSAPHKGVSFDKQTGRWRARIRVKGKLIALGRHDSPELAHAIYVKAAREHFGEFARP